MLLYIDESLLDIVQDGASDEDIEAISNIAQAKREGKHLLTGDRNTLDRLAQWSALHPMHSEVYRKAVTVTQLTQMRQLIGHLPVHVRIVHNTIRQSPYQQTQKPVIEVPVSYFRDTETIQPTILLNEGSDDAILYEAMGKCFRWMKHLRTLKIRTERRLGGGDQIAGQYSNLQAEGKRFCLCIADSDRTRPDGSLGTTASKLRKADDSQRPLCRAYIIKAREAENLLPIAIMRRAAYQDMRSGNGLIREMGIMADVVEIIDRSSIHDLRLWIDLKSRMRLSDLLDPASEPTWPPTISSILQVASGPITNTCSSKRRCSDPDNCSCIIFPGCSSLLNRAACVFGLMTDQKIWETISRSEAVFTQWEKIGSLVLGWCCASEIMSA